MTNRLATFGLRSHHINPTDFTVEGGQCLAITGPSGSGKSVLLRMIADLILHEGDCSLDGVSASTLPAPQWRKLVRYVASEPGWWAPSVAEHFSDPAGFSAAAEALGLPAGVSAAAPERLSTGERQRVALLRAIEQRPRVLLLDEPTSALDEASTLKVEALIEGLRAEELAIILVSHNAGQVARLATATFTMGACS